MVAFNDFGIENQGAPSLAIRQNTEHRRGRIVRTAVDDSNHTIALGEYLIAYTDLTAPRVLSLPSAGTFKSGQAFAVKDESGLAGTHNITIDPSGSQTIDGASTLVMSSNYEYVEFYTDSVAWYIRG